MTEPSTELAPAQARPATTLEWLANQTGVEIFRTDTNALMISFQRDFSARFNFLAPISQVTQNDPNWTPTPRIVHLDPRTDAYKTKGKFQLTKQGLMKLAQLAQIEFYDSRWDYMGGAGVSCTVYARQRGQDGLWRLTDSTKTIWFAHEERRIRNQAKDEATAQGQIDEFYEHVARKVQTKARTAAIRELLALPNGYTQQELTKPFFVIGYVFTPDYTNPHVEAILKLQAGQATEDLYGGNEQHAPPSGRALPAAPPVDAVDDELDDPPDAEDVHRFDGDDEALEGSVEDDSDIPWSENYAGPEGAEDDPEEWGEDEPAEGAQEAPAAPQRPAESFTPTKGPFTGVPVEKILQREGGPEWLRNAIKRMKTPEKRQQGLDWLSYGEGKRITIEDL